MAVIYPAPTVTYNDPDTSYVGDTTAPVDSNRMGGGSGAIRHSPPGPR